MSKVTFDHHASAIEAATEFADLWDTAGDEPEATYKTFAKIVHPDAVLDPLKARATTAFARLQVLWDEYNGKSVGASGPVVISTKKRTFVLGNVVAQGSIANVYDVSWNDGVDRGAVLKMPRSPADSDLMEREAKALRKLDDAPPEFRMYAPALIETFRHKDGTTRALRRCNVIEPLDGFYSVAQVASMFPGGLDPRDVAWMWRRLFVAIGVAADNGIVHGAVVPENIMIEPVKHGVVLVDWCYSCMEDGQTIPAIIADYRSFYPQSVLDKEPPTYAIDVAMAARSMVWLCGPLAPREFRAFANGCAVSSPPKPAELLGEFDELLLQLYGPRKYRLLTLPV